MAKTTKIRDLTSGDSIIVNGHPGTYLGAYSDHEAKVTYMKNNTSFTGIVPMSQIKKVKNKGKGHLVDDLSLCLNQS